MVRLLIALVAAAIILRVGFVFIRGVGRTPPEPPPAGELRKLNRRYRCAVCGAEVRMTLAADEEPPPPRHCLEDMDRLKTLDDD